MREAGILRIQKRKFRVTTDSNHNLPVADNLLNRDFHATTPNMSWLSDITYIRTDEGWLHLAAVMDIYSGELHTSIDDYGNKAGCLRRQAPRLRGQDPRSLPGILEQAEAAVSAAPPSPP